MPRSDTCPDVQKKLDELWRHLSGEERFLKGLELIQLSRGMFLAGVRARFPHFTEDQIRAEALRELYKDWL